MKLLSVLVVVLMVIGLVGCGSVQITPKQRLYFKTDTDGVVIGAIRVFKNLKLTELADFERQKYISEFWREALQNALKEKGVKVVKVITDKTLIVETDIGERYSYISLKTGGKAKIKATFKKGKEEAYIEAIVPMSKALGQSFFEWGLRNYAKGLALDIKKML
jgi:hypothetical protein